MSVNARRKNTDSVRSRLGWGGSFGCDGEFFIIIGGPQVHEHSVKKHRLPALGTAR
jgi:hypothetical protein